MADKTNDGGLIDKLIEALIGLLAPIVDKFKAGNPLIFVVIQAVLFTFQFVIMNIVEWGLIPESAAWVETALQIVDWLLIALVGSRTSRYLNPEDKT